MIIYDLPLPPSVNAMYAHRRRESVRSRFSAAPKKKRGRVKTDAYTSWCKQAGLHVLCQGPLQRVSGPVVIRLTVTNAACGDLDNRYKGVSDFLVRHKIIEDDKADIVKEIRMRWGDVEGARVEIWQADDPGIWQGEGVVRRNLARRSAA